MANENISSNGFNVMMTDEDVVKALKKELKERLGQYTPDMDFDSAAECYVKKGLYKASKPWEETIKDLIQFLAIKESANV